MADEPLPPPETTSEFGSAPGSASGFAQLTQVRVPLDAAGEAFSVPDASGRLPIVVLPKQPFRIRNELVIGGVVMVVVGLLLDLQLVVRGGLVALGALAIFLGVFQSFIVAVPEGPGPCCSRRVGTAGRSVPAAMSSRPGSSSRTWSPSGRSRSVPSPWTCRAATTCGWTSTSC